jgi:hypothetical protein
MAFTSEEKYKIIRFLGYPANTLRQGSLSYSKIISDRLLDLESPAEEEVRGILDRLDALDTSLQSGVSQAGVKRIDDIEFFGASEGATKLEELRRERRRLIKELAMLLDICAMTSGSMGDVCV